MIMGINSSHGQIVPKLIGKLDYREKESPTKIRSALLFEKVVDKKVLPYDFEVLDNLVSKFTYVHSMGWVHKDVCSNNIIGDIILDFGNAKCLIDYDNPNEIRMIEIIFFG